MISEYHITSIINIRTIHVTNYLLKDPYNSHIGIHMIFRTNISTYEIGKCLTKVSS